MTMRRLHVVGVCALLGALLFPGPAMASTPTVVALWNMSEPAGSTVLLDSGPNGLNGTIGTSITLNGSDATFPQVKRGNIGGTYDPQHLEVINSPMLNPGTADFIVTVRLLIPNLADSFGNVMQKGQTGTPGGFWKIQLDGGNGRVYCGFRSIVNGVVTQGGIRSPIIIADDTWHTVTCERGPGFVSTTVDGQTTTIHATVGAVVNNIPLSIGGKISCTAATLHHDCDYFVGSISSVEIDTNG
jgi:Laminin G domain